LPYGCFQDVPAGASFFDNKQKSEIKEAEFPPNSLQHYLPDYNIAEQFFCLLG